MFAACLLPLLLFTLGAFGKGPMDLGADPVASILHGLGKTALNLLLITLAVTPLRKILHRPDLLRIRRMLGLFAFTYVLLHFTAYAWLDQSLDFRNVGSEIVKRPYILVGMTALLLLIPLAVTSTNKMMRRLGRRWQELHRLVYVITALGLWHFYWQVKKDIREPLIYIGIFAVLMGYRLITKSWPAKAQGKTAVPAPSPGN
ncbi:MAG: protein-methionine-sulfoxide reductase heme-binding subunit MsrQ [Pseudomonadota bacterium]